jgi:hypothetical protein
MMIYKSWLLVLTGLALASAQSDADGFLGEEYDDNQDGDYGQPRFNASTATRAEKLCHEGGYDDMDRMGIGYYGGNSDGYASQWYPNTDGRQPWNCTDPASNPRGLYSSHLAPCTFTFHQIPGDDSGSDGFGLPMECSSENVATTKFGGPAVKFGYARNFPDECIKDFPRCYSIEFDKLTFLPFICRKGWQIPENATHLSVDCTQDHMLKLEAIAEEKRNSGLDPSFEAEMRAQKENSDSEIRQVELVLFAILGIMLVSCSGCAVVAYFFVFRPYQEMLREQNRSFKMSLSGKK